MRFLGRISGSGMLASDGRRIGRVQYQLEGFLSPPGKVTTSGEIRLSAPALKGVFGRLDVQLLADDGRLLYLKFSDKKLPRDSDVAQVDATGDVRWKIPAATAPSRLRL